MIVIGLSAPKGPPGRSAAKKRESWDLTGIHLKASLTSFLLNRTGTPGYLCCHHTIALATPPHAWVGARGDAGSYDRLR